MCRLFAHFRLSESDAWWRACQDGGGRLRPLYASKMLYRNLRVTSRTLRPCFYTVYGHITAALRNRLNRCLFANTSIITVSVTRLCSPLGLKAEACDYGKGRYISDAACGVRPITMLCASWPIRAGCACRKEGLCRKRCVWERRGIEELQ